MNKIKNTIRLFKSYFSEKKNPGFVFIKKGIESKILFAPVFVCLFLIIFAKDQWLAKMFLWGLFAVLLIPEIFGRYIIYSDKIIIQRQSYVNRKEINISDIKRVYIRCGLHPEEKGIDRCGYDVLRIETENSFMNISMFYYRKKDLIKLCEQIGFPNTFKKK